MAISEGAAGMTLSERIQLAADLIVTEMHRRGTVVTPADALALARRLHAIWSERHEINGLAPGEIAQRFRERYETGENND